ncbi:TPM domain-containing protein [Anaerotignum sp.]
MKKRIFCFVTFLCMLLSFVPAFADETMEQRVFDYADLISATEEQEMNLWIEEMRESWGLDLAYVTTYDTEGKSARNYGADFYVEHELGLGETYDGVIFVLDMTNREGQIVTCGKAIDIYTDDYIALMWNNMKEYLSDGEYYGAFFSLFMDMNDIAEEYAAYQENPDSYVSPYQQESSAYLSQNLALQKNSRVPMFVGVAAVFSLVIAGISVASMRKSCKNIRPFTDGRAYLKENGFHLQVNQDTFANTHTTMMPVPRNDDNHHHSGGSWGGPSTTFHGGGGRSFGGGGGKF